MNVFDATALETLVKQLVLSGGVTDTVYSQRPKAKEQGSDFAVVSLTSRVDDMACYGDTELSIDLFAKDVKNVKNAAKLSKMYTALMSAIPAESGRYMFSRTPMTLPDVPDDFGYTARIVTFQVIIKHA